MQSRSVLALLLGAAFAMACRGGPQVRNERGAGHEPETASTRSGTGTAHSSPRPSSFEAEPTGEGVAVTPIGEEPTEGEPELDLALRVRNAYGYPAECLGPGAVNEGVAAFSIRLSVTMTATGMVTRSSVYAPVSGDALRCLERRAESLRVAGPIPDAPRTVSTSIDVEAVDRVAAAQTAGQPANDDAPYVPPNGAQPAAQVLPAVVGDGPAPGSVRPDSTLPAVVGDGPAAGSVAADITLPARGAAAGGQGWTWISGSAEARGEVPDRLPEE